MAYDEGVAQRIREAIGSRPGISERKMFGGLAIMAHGHMFVGVLGERLMARIPRDDYEQALKMPHVREMDFTGKPMKGYVYVEPPGFESDGDLAYWVEKCYAFVGTLPPKG